MKVVPFENSDVYEPTVAFSQDRSSSNFDDSDTRFGVGRNGYGAKATNVFSRKFQVETYDPRPEVAVPATL
jgi:DNA topoisomerase II